MYVFYYVFSFWPKLRLALSDWISQTEYMVVDRPEHQDKFSWLDENKYIRKNVNCMSRIILWGKKKDQELHIPPGISLRNVWLCSSCFHVSSGPDIEASKESFKLSIFSEEFMKLSTCLLWSLSTKFYYKWVKVINQSLKSKCHFSFSFCQFNPSVLWFSQLFSPTDVLIHKGAVMITQPHISLNLDHTSFSL